MKAYVKFLAFFLALLMIGMTAVACGDSGSEGETETIRIQGIIPSGTADPNETDAPYSPNEEAADVNYNIIFALATVPPVLASMDAIDSGYETYAIIERGKTYNGIDRLEYFHNAGFDPNNNTSNGFTSTEFNAMVEQIKALNDPDKDVYFNIYVQDGTALLGAALAANAGLTTEDFHVIILEDGTGAYNAMYNTYVKGKTVTEESDGVYESFVAAVDAVKADFDAVMSKTDNDLSDTVFKYNIGKAYALAALDNFTYWIQDSAMLADVFISAGVDTSKLVAALGYENGTTADLKVKLKFRKISEEIKRLDDDQRSDYLMLMYGDYYQATYEGLTRTERAGEKAPDKKLVYIGARHKNYPTFASDATYGIGGLAADATVPATYAELDAKYKTSLLFGTEADYQLFLNVINNADNYSSEEVDDSVKRAAQVATFNYYIDYIYTLKLTYALYGEEYDIIMKGHPREAVGGSSEWGGVYTVPNGEGRYGYDKLIDAALVAFHADDSVGKYFGMVPYGTSAENLAYLGVELSIAGLPSSTYNGYDTAVDVVFIMAATNEDITGSGSETPASQVKARYDAETLHYTNAAGETLVTEFYNTGNTYQALIKAYTKVGDTANAQKFTELFNAWLQANHPGANGIDGQGFAITAAE